MAKTLAAGFMRHGHEVMLGTRNLESLADWRADKGRGSVMGSMAQAAEFGDLLVLAVKGEAAASAMRLAGASANGKTVIDTTNPIDPQHGPENGVIRFTTNLQQSLMEQLQHEFPAVHFVKAFNSVGSAHMIDPHFGQKPTMFICGNAAAAKAEVTALLQQVGWEVCDMGSAEGARAIEPLCMLWCIPGFLRNEWNHAFKLLVK